MIRNIIFWVMVLSFFGLSVCDLKDHQYRTALASLLLGIVQLIVFWR